VVIDSHQHFWSPAGKGDPWDYGWLLEPEHGPINRSFTPADLAPLLADNGVSGSIFVQAQHHLDETRWAIAMAEENEFLFGVVGFVDLQSPEIEAQLDEVCQSPWFKGVRHVVQDEPDDNFLLQPAVVNGLKALARRDVRFDLLVQPRHLKMLPELARTVPDLQMVIDHCAKPAIKSGDTERWHREFRELAQFENLCCKISGLVTEADWKNWSVDQLKPIFATVLETFGSERLLYGSDWPVCTLAATYHQVFESCKTLIAQLSADEQAAILGANARRFYKL
jgi:L-fuconolactonase